MARPSYHWNRPPRALLHLRATASQSERFPAGFAVQNRASRINASTKMLLLTHRCRSPQCHVRAWWVTVRNMHHTESHLMGNEIGFSVYTPKKTQQFYLLWWIIKSHLPTIPMSDLDEDSPTLLARMALNMVSRRTPFSAFCFEVGDVCGPLTSHNALK